MLDQARAPIDETITIDQLTNDPYPIYKRLRAEAPVLRVASVGRTLLTKAADTKYVKDNPDLFSSDDPNTPMHRAFNNTQTLMRKDGIEHRRERMAMAGAFAPKVIETVWVPAYKAMVTEFLDSLPKDEPVDLFPMLAGPLSARILAHCLGMPRATDRDMQDWSQILIDGAGNFGLADELFRRSDAIHPAIDDMVAVEFERLREHPDKSALSAMAHAKHEIAWNQVLSNIKIAIGGGINEPRDSICTALFGLLTNLDQLDDIKRSGDFMLAFDEAVRWVAPIQVSSRRVTEDTEIRGCAIPAGDVVMTIQASANHDEELFEDGHLFNCFRDKAPHQSFGSGPHHCLGAHLARNTVGRILLPMFFERFPNARLVDPDQVVWKGFGFRGPLNLPVILN